MQIWGMQKVTYLDYPWKIAALIFTVWCNMRCKYCYNSNLVLLQSIRANQHQHISEDDFFAYLEERKTLLDGVVICGWEPTLQNDLPSFIEKIKAIGYSVKLDTNGSNPAMLQHLLDKKLIDYVAMDIKDNFDTMTELTQSHIDLQWAIKESIKILSNSDIAYEFRTTVSKPYHTKEKIESIASYLQGNKKYVLQNFFTTSTMIDPSFVAKSFTHAELHDFQNIANRYIPTSIRE